jgi:hypothetical protein
MTPRPQPGSLPLDHVRPLAVDAAYSIGFEALAPAAWSERIVTEQLFKACDMERAGWTYATTHLDDMGAGPGYRRWLVTRIPA